MTVKEKERSIQAQLDMTRVAKGWSYNKLASKADLACATVIRTLTQDSGNLCTVQAIAAAMGLTLVLETKEAWR